MRQLAGPRSRRVDAATEGQVSGRERAERGRGSEPGEVGAAWDVDHRRAQPALAGDPVQRGSRPLRGYLVELLLRVGDGARRLVHVLGLVADRDQPGPGDGLIGAVAEELVVEGVL